MNEKMNNTVFISYASEDREKANKLFDFLKSRGLNPWIDKKNIRAGEKWNTAIMTALRKADFIILLLSKISVEKRGYVQREFKLALDFCKEKLETDIYLIPCKIDDCKVPEELREFQWVEMSESDALEQILYALNYQRSLSEKPEENGNNIINNIERDSDFVIDSEYKVGEHKPVALSVEMENTIDTLSKDVIERNSGFVIGSEYKINGHKPLVLPVERGNNYVNLIYTTDTWDKDNKAPYYDSMIYKNRHLPIVNDKYPYLTISDFLTDTIVRMPYEIDNNYFFDGNIDKTNGNSYLLPLTRTFFNFFTVKDLTEKLMKDNKKMFELKNLNFGVTAVLRIPIQKGYIEYRRTYFEAGVDANETKNTNDGALLEKKFGLGIMPLVRFPEVEQKHYRIALFDKGRNDAVLTCYDRNNFVETKQVIRSKKDLELNICSCESYVIEENFDCIQVNVGDFAEGYIVPKFKINQSYTQFTFAIDFGTFNTHIEYCTNINQNPVAFNIAADERQLCKLHKLYADPDIRWGFVHNFIPDTIGNNDVFSFPIRTVFAQNKNIKYDKIPMPLADGNIPFLYEKEYTPNYNEIKTNLKLGDTPDRLLEMYLETIFILMRNKVALNGGDLSSTKVVWFYPANMTEAKVNLHKSYWKKAYNKYFGNNDKNIISISESVAQYNYYRMKVGARSEAVTIDIGGCITDVFVVKNDSPKILLSFRFASDAIFGDAYNWDSDNNGFVNMYKNSFKEMLGNNGLFELEWSLKQIESQKKSSDIVAFLFSLIGNKVKDNPSLDFMQQLTDNDRLRYVFIVFYASIIYFIAKSMKVKGLRKPLTLAFSGYGSHFLRILSNETDMITRFTGLIFDGVYADENKRKIDVIMADNSKKVTCKGGVLRPISHDYETIDNIKTILIGDNFESLSQRRYTYADISPEIKQGVVQSVKDFFNFLFDLHKENDDFLSNKLGADPVIFTIVKEICLDETTLSQSLLDSLYSKLKGVTEETRVEETLFFYPLVGLLHDLALKISEME
jgi:hypothetical protein